MTNIRPTLKLPEYGDCLFALQTNPVRGTKGEGALLESLHTPTLLRHCENLIADLHALVEITAAVYYNATKYLQ